jgi:hypothetical protein
MPLSWNEIKSLAMAFSREWMRALGFKLTVEPVSAGT